MAREQQESPLDQTIGIPVIASGVTERRLKEECAAYERRLEMINGHYRGSISALNEMFAARVRSIAADAFVKLPDIETGHAPEPRSSK